MDSGAVIQNTVTIVITLSNGEPMIINVGDDPVSICNALLDVNLSEEDIENILTALEKDKTYKHIILTGNHEGNFELKYDNEIQGRCESMHIDTESTNNAYYLVFTLNHASCSSSFPWWGILLICLGAAFLVTAIFLVVACKNKRIRHKLLPYR